MFVRVLITPLILAEFEHLIALKVNFMPQEFHVVTTIEEMAVRISIHLLHILAVFRSCPSQLFFKIGVLKDFAIFTGKHLNNYIGMFNQHILL